MKAIIISLLLAIFTLGVISDAEAKRRLGGGKSSGMQRESVQKDAATAPKPAAPTQASPAGAAAPAMAGAAPAAAKSGLSKWMGPLAGLAVGGLLASMFMGGGFDGIKFFDILLMAGLAFGAFMLFRMFMRKKAGQMGGNMQYSGAGGAGGAAPSQAAASDAPRNVFDRAASPAATSNNNGRIVAPVIGSGLASGHASMAEVESASANPRIPADFDVPPFERQARAAFIRLQAANDTKDLNDIRDFATPEMYAELALQIQERGAETQPQRTDVVTLSVNVLEVVNENNRAIASVRYSGTIREEANALPESFDEVWHVVKNLADPKSTWQLAGIQQLS